MTILEGRIKGLMDDLLRCPDDDIVQKQKLEKNIRRLKTLCVVADTFDFGELRYALTNISNYKGLVLVDVEAADGTIVHIEL